MSVKPMAALAAVMWIAAFYAPVADGLTCHKCPWTDKECAKEGAKDIKTIECNASNLGQGNATAGGDKPADAAPAPAPAPAARHFAMNSPRMQLAAMADAEKFFCYSVTVKDDKNTWVERGCKATDKTDDCLTIDATKSPTAKVEKCVTCDADKCNGAGPAAISVSMKWALLSAALVANLFRTK